jgi:hypothetical protein
MASEGSNDLPYVPLTPFEGDNPNGGDSLTEDVNIWYQVSSSGLSVDGCCCGQEAFDNNTVHDTTDR